MLKKVIVIIFFLSVAVVYLHNLTRDIYSGDIGDLVTAAYVFGVAHPPGYPLFSLLGYIVSHLPIPLPVVSKVGLISVFSSLAGLTIYYIFSLKVTKSIFVSLLSTSILAFSYLFWLTAELPEGLALNNFFAIVILYLAVEFYKKKKEKHLYLLALFVGLSLTHQLHILTLLPSIAFLVIKHWRYILFQDKGGIKFGWKRTIAVFLFFLIGISVYIYIPIAASRNPPINWDNASNFKNFSRLVLRKDYGGITKSAQNVPVVIKAINVSNYLKTILSVFSYQVLLLGILGFLKLFIIDKRLLITFLLAFLFTGVFSVIYTVNPIVTPSAWGIVERYYVLSTVVLMFFVPYGFILLRDFLNTKFSKPIYSYFILSYFLIIPFLMIKYNFPRTNLSETTLGNTLARNIMLSVPKNAVLFVSGDNTTFSTWYVYYVLKERQDIDIINPPGVGNNLYLDKELNEFYAKNPQTELKEIISKTFDRIRKKRRMFTTYKISPMPKGTVLVPKGLVYEILKSGEVPDKLKYMSEFETNWKKVKLKRRETLTPAEQNFIATETPFIYSTGLVHVGDFLDGYYKDAKASEHYYRRALWIDDTNPTAYAGLAISLYKAYKDCNQSLYNIGQAINLYPVWKTYYIQQYYFAKNCQLGEKKLSNLKQEYENIFKKNIEKEIK